jgi:redox-sensitive bicupin YhaK (pirin superfamily)
MNDRAATDQVLSPAGRLGAVVSATLHTIGESFTAHHFSKEMFDGRMNPLLMVDHFVMTAPTFDPHVHKGISAVTVMFEDSEGSFLNRDTLGHNIALKAGDLYWLAAANGAAHEERPAQGARTHALQIFVDLPPGLQDKPACAFHIRAEDVPVLEGATHRVRVILGRSGGAVGSEQPPEGMTMLDGFLQAHGQFVHHLPAGRQAWIYALSGQLRVCCHGEQRLLAACSATTLQAGPASEVTLTSGVPAHFVLISAKPIPQPFVTNSGD